LALLNLYDIEQAAGRLANFAHRTPIVTSRFLDALAGARLFLKVEAFQVTGSFKFRGMYNRLATLTSEELRGGVVTASSGNAGQALAYAACLHKTRCTVFMPMQPAGRPPGVKRLAAAAYGAEVRLYDRAAGNRDELRDAYARDVGAVVVPSAGHLDVIAGQGTVALELLEDVPSLDTIVVPVAGGGLLAGTTVVIAGISPSTRVVGVEPMVSNDFRLSLDRGAVVTVPIQSEDSIADALLLDHPSDIALAVCREHLSWQDIVLVDDDSIRSAVRALFRHTKLVVEPGGAAGLAALLAGIIPSPGERIGVVISGGNVSPDQFARLIT
jgi:threonine dehydratase